MQFSASWIGAITCFTVGAFGGFLLTGIPHLTQSNWLYLAGFRVLWQIGSAIWLGITTASIFEASRWKFVLPCVLVGGLLCVNPLLDLVRGPKVIEGTLAQVRYNEGSSWMTRARSKTITANIAIETPDGRRERFQPHGRHATQWSATLRQCIEQRRGVRIVLLRHLDSALDVECIDPPR